MVCLPDLLRSGSRRRAEPARLVLEQIRPMVRAAAEKEGRGQRGVAGPPRALRDGAPTQAPPVSPCTNVIRPLQSA